MIIMRKILAISFFLVCPAAFGQLFSFGVRGGVPLTSAYSSGDSVQVTSSSKGYLVGPMVELHLPFGLAVEADALYRPVQNLVQISPNTYESYSSNAGSWEFPILAKYHFLPLPIVKPYVDAGPSFRTVSGNEGNFSTAGLTLGAGVEVKLLRLRIEPEFRYIRWGSGNGAINAQFMITGPSATGTYVPVIVPANLNQAEFLVGIAF
jgi:Outer membrane protein beta-barrel domain